MNAQHTGSNLDDLLREDGVEAATEAVALKRVIAFQVAQEMKRSRISKSEMASRQHLR